ncbi:ATP-binding protein, partial [Limnospira fusiformis KN01]
MAETLTKPKFMDITELLQFVDRLVSQQTGEHLDDLQKSIIQGLLTGKTYKDIAEDIGNDG